MKEEELHRVVVKAVRELFEEEKNYLPQLKKNVVNSLSADDGPVSTENDGVENDSVVNSVADLDTKIDELQQEMIKRTRIEEDYEDLGKEIDRFQEERYRLQTEIAKKEQERSRIKEMKKLLDESEITEYSEALVRKLIEKIIVYDDRCDVEFKSGIIVEVYV